MRYFSVFPLRESEGKERETEKKPKRRGSETEETPSDSGERGGESLSRRSLGGCRMGNILLLLLDVEDGALLHLDDPLRRGWGERGILCTVWAVRL